MPCHGKSLDPEFEEPRFESLRLSFHNSKMGVLTLSLCGGMRIRHDMCTACGPDKEHDNSYSLRIKPWLIRGMGP